MKKINLIIAVLSIGIISIFGINNKEYSISNINYTEGNSNLIGKEVNVKGIDGSFNIMETEGEKVRLLAAFVFDGSYSYNKDGDGEKPVAFESSRAYQLLMDKTETWKQSIENAGGKTDIYKVDIPDIYEFHDLGYFDSDTDQDGNLTFKTNGNTPNWLFHCDGHCKWYTKSITNDKNRVYQIWETIYQEQLNIYIYAWNGNNTGYGAGIKPILETSATNLISSDADVMAYANSFATNNTQNNNQVNDNNAQIVKVPSTGIDKPFIFTVVGLAVIIISGITIWTLVKTNKSRKK